MQRTGINVVQPKVMCIQILFRIRPLIYLSHDYQHGYWPQLACVIWKCPSLCRTMKGMNFVPFISLVIAYDWVFVSSIESCALH